MIEPINDLTPNGLAVFDEVIDVRSPAEYSQDHLPGAVNLPVLSNDERATVGAIYVQDSRFRARRIGAGLIARNAAGMLETELSTRDARYRPLLYCWRGGQRSHALATILSQIGWRVGVVEGGYRTWRRLTVASLSESPALLSVVLIDGQTGVAKSAILARLEAIGMQTIDLERLAAHRGSVFGDLPGEAQPPQKLFESRLYDLMRKFDPARPVFVEAESSRIGRCLAPPGLWKAMTAAPRIVVRADTATRAAHIVGAYGDTIDTPGAVDGGIARLSPFHAKERIEKWRDLAARRQWLDLATQLMRDHYDPLYDRSRSRRADTPLAEITLNRLDPEELDAAAREAASIVKRRR